MILKASQRAGAKQLAVHLLRTDDNDHVEVYELRGFAAEDLTGALREIYAISRGTKCRQYLFSVSFSPPANERVDIKAFRAAIDEVELRNGLSGQARAIVFHEKNGRRHAHCVWSRIRADELKAINLPHFKNKLREISRSLYLEHGWTMPRGLANSEERSPLNFSREEWQQAKRAARDPQKIKEAFQDCWAIADSPAAYRQALEARGFYLARGDRRGFVAVDWQQEVYAISRWTGLKAKDVALRLDGLDDLPSVDEAKAGIAAKIDGRMAGFAKELQQTFEDARTGLTEKRRILVEWQRHERKLQIEMQLARTSHEARDRALRFRRGLRGIWDRVTGRHASIIRMNMAEHDAHERRYAAERQALVDRQISERRELQKLLKAHSDRLEREREKLHREDAPSIRRTSTQPGDRSQKPLRRRGPQPLSI